MSSVINAIRHDVGSFIPASRRDALTEMMRQWFMSMPADQFPNLLALADPLAQGTVDERFELGLDVLIRGLASYIS